MANSYLEEIAERHAEMRREALEDRSEEYQELFAARNAAVDAAAERHTLDLEEIGQTLDLENLRGNEIENAKAELWEAIQARAELER